MEDQLSLQESLLLPFLPLLECREKNYMAFAHCNFLHFSYLFDLWLIDWKGLWVIKKEFLVLAGKYMELFFRLIVIPLHVVALIFHVCP